ncbi:unnamed protein product [Zymoseptoria tritici ST99CH_1E4]|uniref:Carotenoid oxygenase n=1 Tax=Zymoseptoria tritici ST99CH_1E4 TaxID=1276532 RepID=A0A2H1GIM0_ZYMTR|nr:unnamed protein product [Zymoseptoria tritici ST99CH_1E4]
MTSNNHVGNWPNAAGFQVDAEQRSAIELPVKGTFPRALAGTLYRTGPAYAQVGDFKLSHWFDGFTQLYRFQIIPDDDQDGATCKILFNSRRQVDGLMEKARKSKRLDDITFAQKRDPCEGFFGKVMTLFTSAFAKREGPEDLMSGVTVHRAVHGGGGGNNLLETRTDQGAFKTVDATTLEPKEVITQTKLHPDLTGPMSCAHAQFDPVTGDAFNFNLAFGRHATYKMYCTSAATGKTEILATITEPDIPAAYLHAFFLTENYVILCVWSSHYAAGGLKTLWERNVLDALTPFDDAKPVHWLVVDRKNGNASNGAVKRFTSKAMFAFHTVNAFEVKNENGTTDLLCDIVEYPTMEVLQGLYYENLVSDGAGARDRGIKKSTLARYRLKNVTSPSKAPEPAESDFRIAFNGDLPTINPTLHTKPYQYVYGIGDHGLSSFYDSIVKVDLKTQVMKRWSVAKHTPGEPIFVVDEARKDKEDGGWLLSCVLDGEKSTSYLLCLDAETLQEVGKAEGDVPWGIGFHGDYHK